MHERSKYQDMNPLLEEGPQLWLSFKKEYIHKVNSLALLIYAVYHVATA